MVWGYKPIIRLEMLQLEFIGKYCQNVQNVASYEVLSYYMVPCGTGFAQISQTSSRTTNAEGVTRDPVHNNYRCGRSHKTSPKQLSIQVQVVAGRRHSVLKATIYMVVVTNHQVKPLYGSSHKISSMISTGSQIPEETNLWQSQDIQ